MRWGSGSAEQEAASKATAEATYGAFTTALVRLGALKSPAPGRPPTLVTNSAGVLAHLFPLGATALPLLALLQSGRLQAVVAAARAAGLAGGSEGSSSSSGGGSVIVATATAKREKEREAAECDAGLLNVLARVLCPVPLFEQRSSEEGAAGAAGAAVISSELASSPLPCSLPATTAAVEAALLSLCSAEAASALPGFGGPSCVLLRPLNPFLLHFVAKGDRRYITGELGVSDAVQYDKFSAFSITLRALGYTLASRLVAAGVVPMPLQHLSDLFHSDDDDEEEAAAAAAAASGRGAAAAAAAEAAPTVFKKGMLKDCSLHTEFLAASAEVKRAALSQQQLAELDTALAVLALAGRFEEQFMLHFSGDQTHNKGAEGGRRVL
jgi:hypothetical protein